MEEIPERRVPAEPVTRKTIDDYLRSQDLKSITPEEVERLAAFAVRFQLNPFLRELHVIECLDKGQRRHVAVVGYEVYLKKAERTGKLDGWKVWTEGDGTELKAILEVYRHDWAHPFVHEVYLSEAIQRRDDSQPTAFWNRMPKFQLRKVCIAQGFRLCFPEDLGGIPYEPAELGVEATRITGPRPTVAPPKSEPEPTVFTELGAYLEANAELFTAKHLKWIRDQLEKSPTAEKAKAMLGYAKKVVQQVGDPPEPVRSPRGYSSRSQRKPEAVPNF